MIVAQKKGIGLGIAAALLAAVYLIPYKLAAGRAGAESLALPMLLSAAILNSLWLVFRIRKVK